LVGSAITDFYDIELKPGAAASLQIIAAPASSVNREAFETQPIIRALDISGNRAVSFTGNISISVERIGTGQGAVISGDALRAAVLGEVSFTGLGLNGKVGDYTLTYSSGDLATTSHTLRLDHGVATSLNFDDSPTGSANAQVIGEIVVRIFDQDQNLVTTGNPVVTIESTRAAATLTGTSQVPATDGVARFTDLVLTGEEGNTTLSVSVASPISLTDELDILLGYGTATKLFISEAASGAVSRKLMTTQPTIQVLDVSGNEVADFTGELTVSVNGSGVLSGTTTRTFTGSEVVFTDMTLRGPVGTYTLTFQATESGTNRVLTQATQSISLAHGDATQVTITALDTVANAASLGTVTATIRDADNNPITTGSPGVELTISGSTGTTTLTGVRTANAEEGVATFTGLSILGLAEGKTLTATASSLSVSGTKQITLTFGAATQLALVSGVTEAVNRQVFAANSVIEARDSSGNPVNNFSGDVSVSATSGNGTVSGTLTRTGNGSSATVTFDDLLVLGEIGSYVLTFTSPDVGIAATTQAVELNHGTATTLELEISSTAKNNQTITEVVVRIKDANGNLVTTGTPLVTVTGTDLTGTVERPAAQGIATFDDLRFVGEIGPKSVTASISSPSLTSESSTVIVSHGSATQLVLTTSASGAINRAGMTQDAFVTLKDVSGNTVLDSEASVQVAVSPLGSASAELSGTTARTPSSGVVRFTELGLNGQVGQYTLTFSSTGLADITQTITLTHGAAVKLEIASSADTARSGIDFVAQPVVHVLDFDDNLVTTGDGSSVTVTAALFGEDPSEITLSGEAGSRQALASGGIATFTTLRLTGDVGPGLLPSITPRVH
jgi:hypothetical protein